MEGKGMKVDEYTYLKLGDLNQDKLRYYNQAVAAAFPPIIQNSPIILNHWAKVEAYFPDLQLFIYNQSDELIAFGNTVAFHWEQAFDELPNEGWDWMVKKAVADHENGLKPNCLGGLQIIVPQPHLRKGNSKLVLKALKKMRKEMGLEKFIIPIRPTWKWKFPEMSMRQYSQYTVGDKIYDPWIRTHLNAGAEVIKICENSMRISGDVPFWEKMTNSKIERSGDYLVPGALSKARIDVTKNFGEYREANIWIKY